jgi:UDP-GlcNAc:undecaprenyl-phosphate GlcNAc-1-phosphate transferase
MWRQWILWLTGIFGATFALSLVFTFLTREAARRVGFVARPRAERWHRAPTALAGGVGIFFAFAVGSLLAGGSARLHLLAGAAAMFALGFIDDVFHLRPYAKLIGQVMIAALTVLSGAVLPWTSVAIIDQALGLFWIIGITNAINLLDNMDGLAAGVACLGATFQAIFFLLQHQLPQAACAGALAGALVGFLFFNWQPATIFMGDCGALFLGYTLATLATESSYGRSRGLLATIAAPVLVMLVPIFDTTFVTLVRVLRGRPVSQGGRDHTSHRLVTLGLSERKAVGTLLSLGLLGGGIAVLARLGIMAGVWIGAPLVAVTLAFVGIHLARTDQPTEQSDRVNLLSSLAAFGYRRRIFEVMLDALLAMVALVSAFVLRFDGAIPLDIERGLARIFLVVVAVKLAALYLVRAYGGVWRYADARDLMRLSSGAVLGSVFVLLIVGLWLRFVSLSRGALVIDCLVFSALLGASRVSFRFLRSVLGAMPEDEASRRTKVLLWGAGDLGEQLARRLLNHAEEALVPMGFVDDDPLKVGRVIHGLRVYGDSSQIPMLLQQGIGNLVVITSPRVSEERIAAVAAHVGATRVRRLRLLLEDVALTGAPVLPALDSSSNSS